MDFLDYIQIKDAVSIIIHRLEAGVTLIIFVQLGVTHQFFFFF